MAKSSKESIGLGQLIRQSEAARLQLGIAHTRLKHKLDIPSRLKDSMKSEPKKWLGASVAAGFVGSFLLKSKKKRAAERLSPSRKGGRYSLSMVTLLLKLTKPAVKIYATKLLKDYLKAQLRRGIARRPDGEPHRPY